MRSAINNLAQQDLLNFAMNQQILQRLGPQVDGGLSGWLGRFSRSLYLDRVYNTLGLLLQIHNAGILSRSLIDSISYLLQSSGQLFGLIDEDQNPININEVLGKTVESFLSGILGQDVYQGLSENWKRLSSIYTSAVNIYELTLSSMAGMAEGLQTAGQYTGKIGNALKRGGIVMENAYEWMDENFRVKTGRFAAIQRVTDGLQSAEDVVSNLTEISENIQETSENVAQIQQEFNAIKTKINENEEDKATQESTNKQSSQSPTVNKADMKKPPED